MDLILDTGRVTVSVCFSMCTKVSPLLLFYLYFVFTSKISLFKTSVYCLLVFRTYWRWHSPSIKMIQTSAGSNKATGYRKYCTESYIGVRTYSWPCNDNSLISIGLVNNIPTMLFFTGISRNTLTKSYMLLLTECVWDSQIMHVSDTHYHALLVAKSFCRILKCEIGRASCRERV